MAHNRRTKYWAISSIKTHHVERLRRHNYKKGRLSYLIYAIEHGWLDVIPKKRKQYRL